MSDASDAVRRRCIRVLGYCARDVRAMTMIVVGVTVIVDKIPGRDKGFLGQVGGLRERGKVFEGNTGIDNSHDHAITWINR